MVSEWGGMTFLLPYVLFVILIASTGVIEEMALGRAAKSGPIKAFGKCTEIRTGNKRTGEVIGVIPVIGSLALAIGYSVVVGWLFKYTFFALSGGLFHLGQDVAAIEGLFGGTAAAFGNNVWQVIAMLGGIISLMIQGIVSGWMDAVSIYICPLGAMLAAIMLFWVAGKDFALTAVNKGTKKPIGSWFMPLGKYVLVPAALLALVAGALLGGIG